MTNDVNLQVHFMSEEKRSKYYYDVTEIQYGSNGIGAFMIITYYYDCNIKTALHYLDELYNVSNMNGQETYYRNFNL